MRNFTARLNFFLILSALILFPVSVCGEDDAVTSDLKKPKNFASVAAYKELNYNSSNLSVKKFNLARFFTLVNLFVSLDAKWVNGSWTPNKGIVGLPSKVVDTLWSGKYFCGEIDPELKLYPGCYDSIEGTEESIYWKPLGFKNGIVSPNYPYQDDVILSGRWFNAGSLRCSGNECYYLQHQLAYHEAEKLYHYTGKYRDIPDSLPVPCNFLFKLEKIDDRPKILNNTLVQSVNITGEYDCSNGVYFTNTTEYINCSLTFSHKDFVSKNAFFVQVVKYTACNSVLIDEEVRLEERRYPVYNNSLPSSFLFYQSLRLVSLFLRIQAIRDYVDNFFGNTFVGYDLEAPRYGAYIIPDKALKKEDFKRLLINNRYLIVSANKKQITRDFLEVTASLTLYGIYHFFPELWNFGHRLYLLNHPHEE